MMMALAPELVLEEEEEEVERVIAEQVIVKPRWPQPQLGEWQLVETEE